MIKIEYKWQGLGKKNISSCKIAIKLRNKT